MLRYDPSGYEDSLCSYGALGGEIVKRLVDQVRLHFTYHDVDNDGLLHRDEVYLLFRDLYGSELQPSHAEFTPSIPTHSSSRRGGNKRKDTNKPPGIGDAPSVVDLSGWTVEQLVAAGQLFELMDVNKVWPFR